MSRSATRARMRKERQEKRRYEIRVSEHGADQPTAEAYIIFGGKLSQRIKEANGPVVAAKRTMRAVLRDKMLEILRTEKKKTAEIQRRKAEERFIAKINARNHRTQKRTERRTLQGA